ncbi:MAG: hypothetical protein Q9161_002083 [Pseudevernia consocians]
MALEHPQNDPPLQPAPSSEKEPSSNSQDKAWYTENVTTIPPEARQLLEQYSKIPPDQVIPHVLNLRDKAFALHTYACIGQLRFLTPSLPSHPTYPTVLALLRAGATYLDAGCCFAQELRYLVHAGIPSAQLHGFDLEPAFYDHGYELFRDRATLAATFAPGDVLAAPGSPGSGGLDAFVGAMDVVFASSFLHVWDWAEMVAAATRLVGFARPRRGSRVLGRQLGGVRAGSHAMPTKGGSNFRHNVESMRRFWEQVGRETGSEWEVEAGLYDGEELKGNTAHTWSEPGMKMIWWSAVRL